MYFFLTRIKNFWDFLENLCYSTYFPEMQGKGVLMDVDAFPTARFSDGPRNTWDFEGAPPRRSR